MSNSSQVKRKLISSIKNLVYALSHELPEALPHGLRLMILEKIRKYYKNL